MHIEFRSRLLLVILAFWLAGTLAVWLTASNNFRHAKAVFDTAEQTGLAGKLAPVSAEDAHEAMRHLASEINRSIFRFWDRFQLALAVAAFGLAGAQSQARWPRVVLGAALVIALLLALWITPTVLRLGPPLDFVPRDPPPPAYHTFMAYHAVYLLLDGLKMVLLAVVLAAEIRWKTPAAE